MSTTYKYIWIGGLPFLRIGEGKTVEIIIPGFGEKAADLVRFNCEVGVERYICAFYDMKPIRDLEVDYEVLGAYFTSKSEKVIIGNSLGTGLAHKLSGHIDSKLILLCPVFMQNSFWVNTIVKSKSIGELLLKIGGFIAGLLTGIGWKKGHVLRKSIALFGTEGMWLAWRFFKAEGPSSGWKDDAEVFICPNDLLVNPKFVKKRALKLNWNVVELPCEHDRALQTYLAR